MSDARPTVRAHARFVRTSARKARLVVDTIRGRSVPEARTILAFTQRAAAREVEKALESAVANAYVKHQWEGDDLVIASTYVDEGPTLKRWRARARGRAARIFKRTCHITIELAEAEQAPAQNGRAKSQKQSKRAPRSGGASTAKPKRQAKKKAAA